MRHRLRQTHAHAVRELVYSVCKKKCKLILRVKSVEMVSSIFFIV